MLSRPHVPLLVTSLTCLLCLCQCRDHHHQDLTVRQLRHRQLRAEVEALRPRALKLHRTLALERWRLLTGQAPVPRRRPRWISWRALARLRLLENTPQTTDVQRRPLRLLRIFLTRQHLDLRPRLQHRINKMLYSEELSAPGGQDRRFFQLAPLAASGLGSGPPTAQGDLLLRLDRALQQQHRLKRNAAQKIGITLAHLEQEHLEQDMAGLLAGARQAVKQTAPLWGRVRSRLVPTPVALERLLLLSNGGADLRHLPAGKQLASVKLLLSSLGLALQTRGGRPIGIQAGARSAAVAVATNDLRLVHGQRTGLAGYLELFEAAGEAVCLGHGPGSWELWALGQRLGARTLGHLLGLVWLEPRWWARYGSLSQAPEIAPPAPGQSAGLARHQVLASLLRLRIQGVADLVAQTMMDGYWPPGKKRPDQVDPSAAFWLAVRQTQVPLTPRSTRPAPRRLLLTPPYRSPLDMRALVLAHMLLERLRTRQGQGWFEDRKVGPRLLKKLCAPGSVGPRQLMRRLGFSKLDHAAPGRNLERAWDRAGTNKE